VLERSPDAGDDGRAGEILGRFTTPWVWRGLA
jgi:hypothetical protein